jgi:hypothetical protein
MSFAENINFLCLVQLLKKLNEKQYQICEWKVISQQRRFVRVGGWCMAHKLVYLLFYLFFSALMNVLSEKFQTLAEGMWECIIQICNA